MLNLYIKEVAKLLYELRRHNTILYGFWVGVSKTVYSWRSSTLISANKSKITYMKSEQCDAPCWIALVTALAFFFFQIDTIAMAYL